MKYKISELCDINSENLSNKDIYKFINYLDTSNLTENKIEEIKMFIVGKDKIPSRAKRKVKKGDILISTVRPNQKHYGIIKNNDIENLIVSTGFAVLRSNEKVNYNYLYNYLTLPSVTEYLQGVAETSTTAYPSLKPSVIGNLEIDLPSLEEQEKIANILSSLDDKIELNNEMNKTLEEMAQSIFKRWFVDFEFPNDDGQPYKSSGGEMVESELGMIPKGWEIKSYIDIADIQYGYAFKSKLFNENEGMPVIRIRDISKSCSFTYTTQEYNDIYIVKKNDILVGMDGEFKAYIWSGKDSLLNQRVLRIRPKVSSSLAFCYFSIKEPLRYLENSKVGTTVIHLGKQDIDKIKVVYPTTELINKYRNVSDKIINRISENRFENMYLSELRNLILPKLMNGKINI